MATGAATQARAALPADGALTRADGELVAPEGGREAEAVEAAMAAARQKIEDNLQVLQARLEQRASLGAWVREHPLEAVGIAFGIGFLLGARPTL